jgi:hypothetical protein
MGSGRSPCRADFGMLQKLLPITALLFAAAPILARAQCRPPNNSNEARLLAFYAMPIAFSVDPSALTITPGSVRAGVEGAVAPTAPATIQHTGFCYGGRVENTSLAHVFGRPRVVIGLPAGFGLELSYLPPVTIETATPNLGSAAVWVTRTVPRIVTLTLRAHATTGVVRGAITCPMSALQQNDPNGSCYGNMPSRDEFRPDMIGTEVIMSSVSTDAAPRFRFAAALGENRLQPRFRVGFSDLKGGTDNTKIIVNLNRLTALAAATIQLWHPCALSTEVFQSFGDAGTVRAIISCVIRH